MQKIRRIFTCFCIFVVSGLSACTTPTISVPVQQDSETATNPIIPTLTTTLPVTLTPTQSQPTPSVTPEPTFTSTGINQPLSLGYYTGDPESLRAVMSFSGYLDIVSVDVYGVQMDGSILGNDELGVLQTIKSQNLQAYLCVSNYNSDPAVDRFDAELAHAAVVTHKDKVIDTLVQMALDDGYDGVNIDFEDLAYSSDIEEDRTDFTLFIDDLASQLHSNNLKLIISMPAKAAESVDDTWSYPFDYETLGEDADYLQMMTYDQHGTWGDPGPVSGHDWVEACVSYAVSLVDPAKLLIGLPAYGYDWDLTDSDPENWAYVGSSFSWVDIPGLLEKPGGITGWDENALSPFIQYQEGGHNHVAWYENEESIRVKVNLVSKYHLSGLSMWALGKEDEKFWKAVESGLVE